MNSAPSVSSSVRRELTPAQHARIRRQLALIPVYIWIVYSWTHLLVTIRRDQPVRDFAHFYVQGVIALERNAPALYDMDRMADLVPRVVPGAHRMLYPPVYGPQVSLFFSPLARLPYTTARDVWLVLSLLAYAGCGYAVWSVCPRLRDRAGLTALLLAAAPALHFMLGFIQVSAIGLACVTAGFFALRANRPFLAGIAIGSLAYKPPLGLAIAFVFVIAGEWRIVLGAATAAAAQLGAGAVYWGPSIVPAYVDALWRLPGVTAGMEPYRYHMHSWRAFFDLLGLPTPIAFAAYAIAGVCTAVLALWCWRGRGPLALRYSVLLIATILVDPHMYAYDFVLLTPACLLLWDWILGEPDRRVSDALPMVRFDRLRGRSFKAAFQGLLYVCYFSPLFATLADVARVQVSVLALGLLGLTVFGVLVTKSTMRN